MDNLLELDVMCVVGGDQEDILVASLSSSCGTCGVSKASLSLVIARAAASCRLFPSKEMLC